MRYELADFRFRHFFRMLLVVKDNEAADPAYVSTLGAKAKVSDAGDNSDLVEKFWTGHRSGRIL